MTHDTFTRHVLPGLRALHTDDASLIEAITKLHESEPIWSSSPRSFGLTLVEVLRLAGLDTRMSDNATIVELVAKQHYEVRRTPVDFEWGALHNTGQTIERGAATQYLDTILTVGGTVTVEHEGRMLEYTRGG